jgi:hypothetical protein
MHSCLLIDSRETVQVNLIMNLFRVINPIGNRVANQLIKQLYDFESTPCAFNQEEIEAVEDEENNDG